MEESSAPSPTRWPWSELLPLLAVLSVALFLRLYPVLNYPETERSGAGGFGDTLLYHRLAYHLVTGHGYSGVNNSNAYGVDGPEPIYEPAVTRGPTYPFFLAAIYASAPLPRQLTDWSPVWRKVRLIQSCMDGIVCLVVYGIARDLDSRSSRPALCASALYALNPYSRYYCRQILVEPVTIFLMALSLFLVRRSLEASRPGRWSAAGGVCLALVGLGRAEYILIGGAMVAVVAFCARPGKKIRTAGILFFAFALTLLPWTLRMNAILHRFSPMSPGATGIQLWLGTYETNSNWDWTYTPPPEVQLSDERRAELAKTIKVWDGAYQTGLQKAAEYNSFFMDLAKEQMQNRPVEVVTCWLVRVPRLWYQEQIQLYPVPEPSGNLMLVYLCLAGLGVWHYRGKDILPLLCLPVFLTVLLLPLHIESRFCVTTLPALLSLAGLGLGKALERCDHRV